MWILPLLGYAGAILGFCFLTLSIASGLYYLSELVEEHTVLAKRLLTRLIQIIIGVQVALWLLDGFPFWATVLGIFSHVVYLGNMRKFPFVQLTDPLFLLSCGMFLFAMRLGGAYTDVGCSPGLVRSLCLVSTLCRYSGASLYPNLVL
jgi:hypothetical protein